MLSFYYMKNAEFYYKRINGNKFRFVGEGDWIKCREFIVNEFKSYRQWITLLSEHHGHKINHFDVKILFSEGKPCTNLSEKTH